MTKPMKQLSMTALSLSVVLASCGQVAPRPAAPQVTGASAPAPAAAALGVQNNGRGNGKTTTTQSACEVLYAGGSGGVQTDSNMRYGQVGTLILSFVDDTSKGRAVIWMDANLPLGLGSGLGQLQNLPVAAVTTLITPELVARLRELPGLVSIYQDAPLEYYLAESVGYIGADIARNTYGLSGRGVGVAIIDSGVDATHPDLRHVAHNVKLVGPITTTPVGGYYYAETPNSDTTSGHGTHVASTIGGTGAASASGRMRQGVAPEATMVAVGAGDAISILYALQGYDYVMKPEIRETHNIRVISNSWGSSGEFAPYHPINLASKRAHDAGILVVFAAGNSGPGADTLNPYSASPCAMSVAAGDKVGNLASFSSRGRAGDALVRPDVTAPGVRISAARALTGVAATTVPDTDNPLYSSISGTSMATPHISGVLALMLQANPGLTLDTVLDIFNTTSRAMYHTEGGTVKLREAWEVGAGYVDANAAVREAVRLNRDRYTLNTATLSEWSGQVGNAVCLPLVPCTVSGAHNHTVRVPSGATALRVATEWGNPAFDLDLYVYDPSGKLVATSAEALSTGEAVSVPSPVAGDWRVELKGYLNTATEYTGVAEVDQLVRR